MMPAPSIAPEPKAKLEGAKPQAVQKVIKIRRDYNSWVARESMEDYALRFTPRRFRLWSEMKVANTAFGAASFLILEAVGATLLVQYGFVNALWAILATGLIIFLAGLPISVYAARYGVDMDLLTRGAGFGYIGSTITSLIYATFTFIFFALEAAVMAYALELAFGIPPAWGYLICALLVIPLVLYGITTISRLQVWTQPLWIVLLLLPFVFVFQAHPGILAELSTYAGQDGQGGNFNLQLFGAGMTVGVALITQMGEQVDYLRFMPEQTPANRKKWWWATLIGGPGWVVLGVLKMLGGCLLAFLAISLAVPVDRAVDPNQMYLAAYNAGFANYGWAVAITMVFVVVSQLKINVTNAYAGSLAWSNFFSRLTHSHPGRVVWVVFNIMIALVLMELNVFKALGEVLGLYSNVAIAWMMTVVADLVINKPLGLSPKGIEFKRAHLYDINPVGVGAMGMASALSVMAYLGAFGPMAQAFSALIALVTAMVCSPLIAWITTGRYYIARHSDWKDEPSEPKGSYLGARLQASRERICVICERAYEGEDMAQCPAYQGPICSLCCTLDARCDDLCKPQAKLSSQWAAVLQRILPKLMWPYIHSGLGHYLLLMAIVAPLLAAFFGLLYRQQFSLFAEGADNFAMDLQSGYLKAFLALLLIAGIVCWWLVLAHKSRMVAQEESNRQTEALMREIESHKITDQQLQEAKELADNANQAKSRYISAISHELRTPLNSILGYAQLLDEDPAMPAKTRQAVTVIKRGGDHLLSLIEGTLDLAQIEGGKLKLDVKPVYWLDTLEEIRNLFALQTAEKGLSFHFDAPAHLPPLVRADVKRLRQVLINLLGNAVKFTAQGSVTFRVRFAREMASFEIIDTGPGMSAEVVQKVFEPFERGASSVGTSGAGLGLTIAKMLVDLMGGELNVSTTLGQGTNFKARVFLPELRDATAQGSVQPKLRRIGYTGDRIRILTVDNEEADRDVLMQRLGALGFEMSQAASGEQCLQMLANGLKPQIIFMDLAMPGLDGWQTIAALRAAGFNEPHVAIVSANAFDKSLDNAAGITPADFFVKPFVLDELLDWIGQRLGLLWIEEHSKQEIRRAVAKNDLKTPAQMHFPDRATLQAMLRHARLGYYRGISSQLNSLTDSNHLAFVSRIQAWLQAYQFDAIAQLIQTALDEQP
jgi:signal transduction histidine kinase/purine-cytosine permease-like protein/DNA-binding NarL/FixJ family response regulator